MIHTHSALRLQLLALILSPLLAMAILGCDSRPRGNNGGGGSDGDGDSNDTDDDTSDENESEALFGPENSWSNANESDVPADLERTGWGNGDIAGDFELVDQHGDTVQLYQFYGKIIVLDVFAEWCGPCRENAPEGEELWEEGGGEVIVIAVMQENYGGSPPTIDDVNNWVSDFDLTHPVLADPTGSQDNYTNGFPTYVVIDREMQIVNQDLWPFDKNFVLDLL